MENLLVGNGLNIQFGSIDYSSSRIIKRAINNLKVGNVPEEVYLKEIGDWLTRLHGEVPQILAGAYDRHAWSPTDARALADLKKRYRTARKPICIYDIGFEDYFFIHNLFCCQQKIENPHKFYLKEALRRLFLDSIYNSGKVQEIHHHFPTALRQFFIAFQNIFTTNYDKNIEEFSEQRVWYLHGAFHTMDGRYAPNSMAGKIGEMRGEAPKPSIRKRYEHLFSNALTSHSGELKQMVSEMGPNANSALLKLVASSETNTEVASGIESWADSDNPVVKALYDAIKLKLEDSSLSFPEDYPLRSFSEIEGNLDIVGLSPTNDNHLFDAIIDNTNLKKVRYYYFDESDKINARSIFRQKDTEFLEVTKLWKRYE